MIRIFLVCPEVHDNQSWWRAGYPLADMESDGSGEVSLSVQSQLSDLDMRRSSLIFMQRPFDPMHLRIVRDSHRNGRPVIVEFDDLLWTLPPGNPAFAQYTPERIQVATDCALEADWVTCSTQALADHLAVLGCERVTVIPNALPSWMNWPKWEPREKVIWWRGGSFHGHDIDSVADDFVRLASEFPDYKFVFAGSNPTHITRHIKNKTEFLSIMNINRFHDTMVSMRPTLVVNPLQDHPFNHAKSNIAWQEATLAGAVCVAPDFREFQVPGCARYGPDRSFFETAAQVLRGDKLEVDVVVARDYIDHHLRLDLTNARRLAVFKVVLANRSSSSMPEAPQPSQDSIGEYSPSQEDQLAHR